MTIITATMRIAAATISAVTTARDILVEPSRGPRKTTVKPRAAPVLSESSTCVAFQVCDDGLRANQTAAAAAAALSIKVASRNAGRPPRALALAT